MYLKSLTLKGFKSFADRAHMTFEPGLTVIVGPNGSGKSNISDSILWVLGEQSAKQLRGQAMEDVIFSGSSARKPVGVAEVTLVLDNSDHMLPVDFDEVAITRRMYRSGESEYLINSSPCRLMDIQDILHDSGLGKDTHSIISQGKLDAILQSRPEERRALIEEAAGISKHKRRKERALKKIKSMDEHLTRARDINKEIARQLRPLERQVDRARKYKELSSRANELTQMLAVDELRSLQSQWNDLESRSKEGAAELELAQYRMGEKERELEKLQVMLEEKGLFVGDLGEQRRHMQDVVGRINSDMRLLEEKGHNMVSRLSDMRGQISSSEHQRRRVVEELEDARAQLEEVTGAHMQAQEDVDAAGPAAAELHERRVALDNQISQLTREHRDVQCVADNAALELAKVKDSLSNAEVEDNMYASRLEQIDEQLEEVMASLESRRDRAEELEGALEEARQAQADAREATEVARAALKDLRNRESEARNKLSEVRSELASQQKLDARMADSSPLVSRLVGALGDDVLGRLGDVLEAPRELEGLVEQLLAGDIDALLFDDAATLERAGRAALDQKKASGEALLVARGVSGSTAAEGAAGTRLVDRLSVRAGYGPVVEALLGGYYVVDDLAAALAAPVVDGVTYVTPDGARVSCGGLVRVGLDAGEASGALERKRRIRELEGLEPDLAAVFEHVSDQVVEANVAVEEARAAEGDAAGRELNQLVRQINNLGPVNQVAMEEYEQLKRRADYIEEQLADLESARKALTKITVAIDRKMRKAFLVTFEKVDANFREIFAMLFPGGQAHLEMTDPEHPAETGIEVVAQPRGKRITKMMLMSGGEKSLTALALLFAVYRTRTVPFYVLDEVEAALDDANLSKLIGALDVLRSDTQLLVISHQRRTMEDADVLYGVSMQADGVSRVVSQKLDRETGKVVNA